jgi:hypothetical protein
MKALVTASGQMRQTKIEILFNQDPPEQTILLRQSFEYSRSKISILPIKIIRDSFFIILLLLLSFSSIYAQRTKASDPKLNEQDPWNTYAPDTEKIVNLYNNEIGIRYSNISGFGLSIGRRIFDDYAICLSGLITYDEEMRWTDMTKTTLEKDHKKNLYDFGLELQRDVFTFRNTKVYYFIGGYYSMENNKDQTELKDENFTVGTGFGLEWFMDRHIASYFHFGFKFDNENKEENGKPTTIKITTYGLGAGIILLF